MPKAGRLLGKSDKSELVGSRRQYETCLNIIAEL